MTADFGTTANFAAGDVVGVMLDCAGPATLRLFRNRAQVFEGPLGAEALGTRLHPALCLHDAEVHIVANPECPP